MSDFVKELEQIVHSGLLLSKLEMVARPATPSIYDYEMTCTDGRIWTQVLRKDLSGVIWYTFAVGDEFLLAEFSLFRPMRTVLERFILLGCTTLEVTF